MKTNRVVIVTTLFCLGVAVCRADLIPVFATYKKTPESTAHILSIAAMKLGVVELQSLLRLEDTSSAPANSPFDITYVSTGVADVSWNLTGTGNQLSAIYIFGGSNGANLYKIDPSMAFIGSAQIHTPVTGNSGQYAGISHTLFLGGPPTAVPEPSSIVLLTIGAGFLARKLRKPSA